MIDNVKTLVFTILIYFSCPRSTQKTTKQERYSSPHFKGDKYGEKSPGEDGSNNSIIKL